MAAQGLEPSMESGRLAPSEPVSPDTTGLRAGSGGSTGRTGADSLGLDCSNVVGLVKDALEAIEKGEYDEAERLLRTAIAEILPT